MDDLTARLAGWFGQRDARPYSNEKILDAYSDKIVSTDDGMMAVTDDDTDHGKIAVIDHGKMVSTDDDKMVSADDDKMAAPASWVSYTGRQQTISENATAVTDQLLKEHSLAITAGRTSPLAFAAYVARLAVRNQTGAAFEKEKNELADWAAFSAVSELTADEKAIRPIIMTFVNSKRLKPEAYQSLVRSTWTGSLVHEGTNEAMVLAKQAEAVARNSLRIELADAGIFDSQHPQTEAFIFGKMNGLWENGDPEVLRVVVHDAAVDALNKTAGKAKDTGEGLTELAAWTDDTDFSLRKRTLERIVDLYKTGPGPGNIQMPGGNVRDTAREAAQITARDAYSSVGREALGIARAKAAASLETAMQQPLQAWLKTASATTPAGASVQALRVQTIKRQATAIADQLVRDHADAIAAGAASPLASAVNSARRLATESAAKHIGAALAKVKGDLARKAATDAVSGLAKDDEAVRSIIRTFRDDNALDKKTYHSLLHPKRRGDKEDLWRLATQAEPEASTLLGNELARTFGLVPSAINAMLDVKIDARVENPEALKILAHHIAESALLTTAGTPTDDEASDTVAAKLNDIGFLDVTLQGNSLDATGEQAAKEAAETLYADSAVTSAMQNAASAKAKGALLSEMAPRLLAWVEENPAAATASSSPARPTGRQVSRSPTPTPSPDLPPSYESLEPIGPLSLSASGRGRNQNPAVEHPVQGNMARHAGSSPAGTGFSAAILNRPRANVAGSPNRLGGPGGSRFPPSLPGRLHQGHGGPGSGLQQPSYGTRPQASGRSFHPGWATNLGASLAAGPEPLGVVSSQAPVVEAMLRQVFEGWIPRNAPTFAENVKVLDGPAFEAFYRQSHGDVGNIMTVNTFTTTASDGTVRIWVRKGFEDEHALAYSLLHAYASPAFLRLAGNCIVDQGDGNSSDLSSGILHFIVSQLTGRTVVGRQDVEIAGQIHEMMGDEKCLRAVFPGNPAALADFKGLAQVLGIVVRTDAE